MKIFLKVFSLLLLLLLLSCRQDKNHVDPEISKYYFSDTVVPTAFQKLLNNNYYDLKLIFDSLTYYKSINDTVNKAKIEAHLAEKLRSSGNYYDAISYLYKASGSLRNDSNSNNLTGKIYNGLAANYYELYLHNKSHKEYLDSSEFYTGRALKLIQEIKNPELEWGTMNILGAIKIHRNSYTQAIRILKKALAIQDSLNETSPSILANLSYAYCKIGDYEQALNYAEKCNKISIEMGNKIFEAMSLKSMAMVHEARGDMALANESRDRIEEIKLNKDFTVRSLMNKQFLLKYEKKQMEKKVISLYNDKVYLLRLSRILSGTFILLIVIGSFISFMILNNQRKHKRVTLQQLHIQKQENEIQKDKVRILKQEKELEAEKSERYKLQMQVKEQELVYQSLKLTNLAKINKSVKEKLGPFQYKISRKKDQEQFIREMNEIFRESSRDPLADFEDIFLQMHDDFYKKLIAINPELTRSELQLCALLKMNLPTKEIANLLNLSPFTIDQRRHSIRQKLQLTFSENLSNYLINL
ncbi:MAG: hypothetical protein K9H84_03905 [Bacteroidales bacterium]|nr:hypothetical protein [Bacteroidales bacterium]